MTPAFTTAALRRAPARSVAGAEILVWCPVCGDAPATVGRGGFCSRACRAASLDYHNARAMAADEEYERRGGLRDSAPGGDGRGS